MLLLARYMIYSKDLTVELLHKINKDGLIILNEILEARGLPGSDNYYYKRFLKNEFLNNNDIKIISYIDKNISKDIYIFEPGSGYSQVPLALSVLGYKTFALEVREDRYEGSLYLKDKFSKIYGSLDNFEIIMGRYPQDAPDCKLIITNNFASTFNKKNENSIINTFKRFDYCLLDVGLFGFRRSDQDVAAFLSKIAKMGFSYEKCFDNFYIIGNI